MTYQTKMLFRLVAPAVLVFGAGMALATIVATVVDLPMLLGGVPLLTGVGDAVAIGTGIVSIVVYLWQMLRYWRWTKDEGDMCFVCACLLGRERDGRYGPYRKCLGCGKNHAIGRI